MKAKVIKKFIDKNTKKLHKTGEEIEVTKKRFAEINTVGKLLEAVDEAEKEETAAE